LIVFKIRLSRCGKEDAKKIFIRIPRACYANCVTKTKNKETNTEAAVRFMLIASLAYSRLVRFIPWAFSESEVTETSRIFELRAYGDHDPEVGRCEPYVICAGKRKSIQEILIYHRRITTKSNRSHENSRFVKIWI